MSSFAFTRSDVHELLDEAQLNTNMLFADAVVLRDQLQGLFHASIDECNSQDVDPMKLLHQTMRTERAILDAYNKHRLGNAVTVFNERTIDPENSVEYNEKYNIPERLEWFPLRAEVTTRGVNITAPPIYQLENGIGDNQKYTPAPSKANNTRKAATPRKTVDSILTAKEKKFTGFGSANYNKLKDAPSAWLNFPRGNLTLAEMTTFIPQTIKSYDIIDRFLYNGALSGTLADMINHYRDMPYGPIKNNTIYRMMKGPMDHRAKTNSLYERWTVAKHAAIQKPAGFDPASVSVAGFSTPVNFNSREVAATASQPPPSISFRDMANGVKIMPSGYDALDLTRCVQYCLEHEDGSWIYPEDFEVLVDHLGGAASVHREHQDDAAILRHTSKKKMMNAKRAGARQRDGNGRLLKKKKGFVVDSDEEEALGGESEEESEADLNDFNFDALNDGEPVIMAEGAQLKNALDDDISDEDDFTPCIRNSSKRKLTTVSDDDDYHDTAPRPIPRRNRRPLPKVTAHRSMKTTPSDPYEEVLSEDIDSESDGDAYAGPKNKKRKNENIVVTTRSSARSRRFSGSYNVEEALNIEEEEDEDEDNEEDGQDEDGDDDNEEDDEDDIENAQVPNRRILTPTEMRMVGRKREADAHDATEDDESGLDEDASGEDDESDS